MEVHHDEAQRKFWVEVDGFKADMSYHLKEGHLDIRHTLVPEAIGGRGIASMLVKTAYDYARHRGLIPWLHARMPCVGCRGIPNIRA